MKGGADGSGTDRTPGAPTRRARLRASTVGEIKHHAWEQVASGGATSVSLRAIARNMGMTSSALYRYFESYEQLISELIADGYESLADALEAAEAGIPDGLDSGQRFLSIARAYRAWALGHSTQYGLTFGTPICDPKDNPRVAQEHSRGVNVLFRAMIIGVMTGDLDPNGLPPASPTLRGQFESWRKQFDIPLSPDALAGCMFVWSTLHGAISLELFGQLPPALMPAAEMFDQQMAGALAVLGYSEKK